MLEKVANQLQSEEKLKIEKETSEKITRHREMVKSLSDDDLLELRHEVDLELLNRKLIDSSETMETIATSNIATSSTITSISSKIEQ